MTTTVYNGISYDLQIAGGVLQTRVTGSGSGSWNSHPQMVGLQDDVHLVGNWIVGWTGGSYHSTSIEDRSIFYASDYALYSGAVSGLVPIVITNDAGTTPPPSGSGSSATQTTHETQVSMSGHKIVDGAAGTNPTDFIILSQLTANSQALTTAINAGDAAVQADIDALELVVANLPAGLTIAQVQAAIDASVAETVLNEVIDDNQKQALVDAALSQLSTIDTAVIGRVGAAEAILVSLEAGVSALETLTTTHTADIAAGVAKDASQDQAITSLYSDLAGVINVNNAQDLRLSNAESAAALVNQAITPVEVQVANGAVVSAIGVPLGDVSIDNSNTDHITVSIALGSSNAGKRRVSSAYRVFAGGKEEKFVAAEGRNGETYVFTYLKTRDGSSTVNLVLN